MFTTGKYVVIVNGKCAGEYKDVPTARIHAKYVGGEVIWTTR